MDYLISITGFLGIRVKKYNIHFYLDNYIEIELLFNTKMNQMENIYTNHVLYIAQLHRQLLMSCGCITIIYTQHSNLHSIRNTSI